MFAIAGRDILSSLNVRLLIWIHNKCKLRDCKRSISYSTNLNAGYATQHVHRAFVKIRPRVNTSFCKKNI